MISFSDADRIYLLGVTWDYIRITDGEALRVIGHPIEGSVGGGEVKRVNEAKGLKNRLEYYNKQGGGVGEGNPLTNDI